MPSFAADFLGGGPFSPRHHDDGNDNYDRVLLSLDPVAVLLQRADQLASSAARLCKEVQARARLRLSAASTRKVPHCNAAVESFRATLVAIAKENHLDVDWGWGAEGGGGGSSSSSSSRSSSGGGGGGGGNGTAAAAPTVNYATTVEAWLKRLQKDLPLEAVVDSSAWAPVGDGAEGSDSGDFDSSSADDDDSE